MTPSRIQPAFFRLAVRCRNHVRHRVQQYFERGSDILHTSDRTQGGNTMESMYINCLQTSKSLLADPGERAA